MTWFSVPGHVQDLLVEIEMDDSLSISWERPAQPNDYTLNYTVSVTDISTGTELSRTVLNETQIIVTLPHTHCMVTIPTINGIKKGHIEKAQETSSDSDMHNTVCLCHCCTS